MLYRIVPRIRVLDEISPTRLVIYSKFIRWLMKTQFHILIVFSPVSVLLFTDNLKAKSEF